MSHPRTVGKTLAGILPTTPFKFSSANGPIHKAVEGSKKIVDIMVKKMLDGGVEVMAVDLKTEGGHKSYSSFVFEIY